MSSVSADASSGIRLTIAHYLEALHACAAVVDKPGGGQARSAAIAALELLQDIREARWLSGRQGEEAYFWAMKACIAAQDAWSALALLESAQDDRVQRNMALRTAAMQVIKRTAVTADFPNLQVYRVPYFVSKACHLLDIRVDVRHVQYEEVYWLVHQTYTCVPCHA